MKSQKKQKKLQLRKDIEENEKRSPNKKNQKASKKKTKMKKMNQKSKKIHIKIKGIIMIMIKECIEEDYRKKKMKIWNPYHNLNRKLLKKKIIL